MNKILKEKTLKKKPLTKRKQRILFFSVAIIISILLPFGTAAKYQAAQSYTNAKEFYESTALRGQSYHVEMMNGTIYYATSAKLASSGSNLHYYTIGFDITLSGNEHSVSFTVQRNGGSMEEIDNKQDDIYEYILYAIKDKTLYNLAQKSNPENATYILNAPNIDVKMDAILVTKQGNHLSGGITENGSGGFSKWGNIYRLKDVSDLTTIKKTFPGHTFNSYINILERMPNPLLQIHYAVNGADTDTSHTNASTIATVNSDYQLGSYTANDSVIPYILFENDKPYTSSSRVLNAITLLDPNSIGLKKEGYHLEAGKEWIYNQQTFTNTSYMPQDIHPTVGISDQRIFMFANWIANTYSVTYDANGGMGTVIPTTFTYDKADYLRSNTFSKTGYYLEPGEEWNTKPDGTGKTFGSNELVSNLTSSTENLTLYSNWKPIVVSISTDKKGGTDGTDIFYEKYNIGFFSDSATTYKIDTIQSPIKTGYLFHGYFENYYPIGNPVIDSIGTIQIPSTYYLKNTTLYADYVPKSYTLTFDKQGGSGGTDNVTASYDKALPFAEAPIKTGWSFKGYFTQPNGMGTMYYNEFMASDIIYNTDNDITLYAYWIDETPPDAYLTANITIWTNRTIELNASASDLGTGLYSIALYQDDSLIENHTDLNGIMQKSFIFHNNKQGIIQYRLFVTDMSGNTREVLRTIYSDTKAPSASIVNKTLNASFLSITVDVTDINVP